MKTMLWYLAPALVFVSLALLPQNPVSAFQCPEKFCAECGSAVSSVKKLFQIRDSADLSLLKTKVSQTAALELTRLMEKTVALEPDLPVHFELPDCLDPSAKKAALGIQERLTEMRKSASVSVSSQLQSQRKSQAAVLVRAAAEAEYWDQLAREIGKRAHYYDQGYIKTEPAEKLDRVRDYVDAQRFRIHELYPALYENRLQKKLLPLAHSQGFMREIPDTQVLEDFIMQAGRNDDLLNSEKAASRASLLVQTQKMRERVWDAPFKGQFEKNQLEAVSSAQREVFKAAQKELNQVCKPPDSYLLSDSLVNDSINDEKDLQQRRRLQATACSFQHRQEFKGKIKSYFYVGGTIALGAATLGSSLVAESGFAGAASIMEMAGTGLGATLALSGGKDLYDSVTDVPEAERQYLTKLNGFENLEKAKKERAQAVTLAVAAGFLSYKAGLAALDDVKAGRDVARLEKSLAKAEKKLPSASEKIAAVKPEPVLKPLDEPVESEPRLTRKERKALRREKNEAYRAEQEKNNPNQASKKVQPKKETSKQLQTEPQQISEKKAASIIHSNEVDKLLYKNGGRVPPQIVRKVEKWENMIREQGIREVRKIPGFHDEVMYEEPWRGYHSIRLNDGYRLIYRETDEGIELVNLGQHIYAH